MDPDFLKLLQVIRLTNINNSLKTQLDLPLTFRRMIPSLVSPRSILDFVSIGNLVYVQKSVSLPTPLVPKGKALEKEDS